MADIKKYIPILRITHMNLCDATHRDPHVRLQFYLFRIMTYVLSSLHKRINTTAMGEKHRLFTMEPF